MNKLPDIFAVIILAGMFLLLLGSSWNDSATFDEIAHIPSGYTALKYQDSRLNPEHPPLIKDLAALPLLFKDIKFDLRPDFWENPNVNDRQWQAGHALLYEYGNDSERILFAARLPIIFLSIIFGRLLYGWVKKQYGFRVGLLTLFFYGLSPTVLAHSRYVTTDIGAALGFFLGIVFFLKFLERPDWKRTIQLGLILGMVLMFKFSIILLLPVYGILFAIWIFATRQQGLQEPAYFSAEKSLVSGRRPANVPASPLPSSAIAAKTFGMLFLSGLIAIGVIWVTYAYHTWNYPQEQQLADVERMLAGYKVPYVAEANARLVKNEFTRPLGQYIFGFLMTARRTAGGNTAYFMGEVSAEGWWYYFPVIYLLKEQLIFILFALGALWLAIAKALRGERSLTAVKEWISMNFSLTASLVFIAVYWAASVANPLNIGVRHVLPTFPFIYFLAAREIIIWLRPITIEEPQNIVEWAKSFYETYLKPAPKYFFVFVVLFLMILNMVSASPYFLSFYNILGGGMEDGYMVATDSNYDWGQDLKRLAARTEELKTGKIYLDYFGGGDPRYYFGNNFEPWWSAKGPPPAGSYFAVSVNSLMGNRAYPVGNITIKPEDTYSWLEGKTPVARGGMSILIYKF